MLQGPSLPPSDLRQYYQPGSVWDSAEATCSLQAFCCLTEDKEARTAHAQQALAAAQELSAKQDAERHCQLKVLEEGAGFAFYLQQCPEEEAMARKHAEETRLQQLEAAVYLHSHARLEGRGDSLQEAAGGAEAEDRG